MRDWTYVDYLAGLMAERPQDTRLGTHFWHRQRWPEILRAWQPWVTPANLVVVTVPPAGAPPRTLWDRFCRAAGFAGREST